MNSHLIYAKRIYLAQASKWNRITNEIRVFSYKNHIDPYIILCIYYIEDYFRPSWIQLIESSLHKVRILKDPSIGPFQVRTSHLNKYTSRDASTTKKSLSHILSLLKISGLDKKGTISNYASFGKRYNLDSTYGYVLHDLYNMVKHTKWKKG